MLDFADFAWLEQPEGNLMDAISWVWYNGSYIIAAKPSKASNYGAIYKDLYGINKVLSLLNERGDPPFLFPNLSSYNTNNQ